MNAVGWLLIALAGMLSFSCRQKANLSPEEALRAIKAFDSDLTQLVSSTREEAAFKGLSFLLTEKTSPLNYPDGMPGQIVKDTLTGIENWYGEYAWDDTIHGFRLIRKTEDILITFPPDSFPGHETTMSVRSFQCLPGMNLACFPVQVQAEMGTGNDLIFNLLYTLTFADNLPEKGAITFSGQDYAAELFFEHLRTGEQGNIKVTLSLEAKGHRIIYGTLDAEIGYSGEQTYLLTLSPALTIFDVMIEGKLDYSRVDPTSHDYLGSFNENCRIGAWDRKAGKLIGNLGLGTDKTGELLEWVIYLYDGTTISLYDYVLVFREIMDYKYPNRV